MGWPMAAPGPIGAADSKASQKQPQLALVSGGVRETPREVANYFAVQALRFKSSCEGPERKVPMRLRNLVGRILGILEIFGILGTLGVLTGAIAAAGPAQAAELTGVWMVADGTAKIQIDNCGGSLWGVVVWEREPGHDMANPDASLRGRPTLGIPILLGLRPGAQQGWQGGQQGGPQEEWRGHVYNAKNGETYEVHIRLASQDVLHLEGCVLGGLFCGGENWSRAAAPPGAAARRTGPKASSPVCLRISDGAARSR
jgi:uncharacterized protein (DUF2147 family)